MNATLARARREIYASAVYEAELETGHVTWRVGRAPQGPAPGGALAIVTAWNPAQERPENPANARANAQLAAEIERLGLRHSPARGRSEDCAHVEPSFAIADISPAAAVALGRRFRQAAVFYWDGGKAEILACTPVAEV